MREGFGWRQDVPDGAASDGPAPHDGPRSEDRVRDLGTQAHVVFVTSTVISGALGGLAGADTICQERAAAAGWGGVWRAIMSDGSTDARDRIAVTRPVRNAAGLVVATGATDLWDGEIENPIDRDEHGVPVSSEMLVWDASHDDGTKYPSSHCGNWTSSRHEDWGELGRLSSQLKWIDDTASSCDATHRVYCISQ